MSIKIGDIFIGRIVTIRDFGAYVEIQPGVQGLLHISELTNGYVANVTDVVKLNDKVQVKVIKIEVDGRLKLSRRALLDGDDATAVAF